MKPPAGETRVVPIHVVIPPRVLLLDVAGPIEVLRRANLEQSSVRFTVAFVSPRPVWESSIGLTLSRLAPLPGALPADGLVLLPGGADSTLVDALGSDPAAEAVAEDAIVTWLARAIRPGMRLASICSGALLAGRAGLLDGFECTTHHGTIAELARVAPRARVLENRLFVDDGERLTSAGVTAGIDLMLHLVANEVGQETALAVARHLVVYLRRAGSDPQLSAWLEGRNHIHPALHRVQDAIARDPAAPWPMPRLAREAGTSARNLARLFAEHARMSATDYVNRLRIARAHELVTASRLGMERIAESSGFASSRQFRRAWNRLHALPPSRMRSERQQC